MRPTPFHRLATPDQQARLDALTTTIQQELLTLAVAQGIPLSVLPRRIDLEETIDLAIAPPTQDEAGYFQWGTRAQWDKAAADSRPIDNAVAAALAADLGTVVADHPDNDTAQKSEREILEEALTYRSNRIDELERANLTLANRLANDDEALAEAADTIAGLKADIERITHARPFDAMADRIAVDIDLAYLNDVIRGIRERTITLFGAQMAADIERAARRAAQGARDVVAETAAAVTPRRTYPIKDNPQA